MFGNAFKQIVLLDVKVRIVHNVSTGVSMLQDASQHHEGAAAVRGHVDAMEDN